MNIADDRDPWERQPKETDRSWSGFLAYRDAGPVRRLADKDKNQATTWKWRHRAAEYDRHLDDERRAVDLKAVIDMRERHIKVSQLLLSVGMAELSKFAKQSKENPGRPMIKVSEALDLSEHGIRLERLNRGEPETVTAANQRVELSWTELVERAHAEDAPED